MFSPKLKESIKNAAITVLIFIIVVACIPFYIDYVEKNELLDLAKANGFESAEKFQEDKVYSETKKINFKVYESELKKARVLGFENVVDYHKSLSSIFFNKRPEDAFQEFKEIYFGDNKKMIENGHLALYRTSGRIEDVIGSVNCNDIIKKSDNFVNFLLLDVSWYANNKNSKLLYIIFPGGLISSNLLSQLPVDFDKYKAIGTYAKYIENFEVSESNIKFIEEYSFGKINSEIKIPQNGSFSIKETKFNAIMSSQGDESLSKLTLNELKNIKFGLCLSSTLPTYTKSENYIPESNDNKNESTILEYLSGKWVHAISSKCENLKKSYSKESIKVNFGGTEQEFKNSKFFKFEITENTKNILVINTLVYTDLNIPKAKHPMQKQQIKFYRLDNGQIEREEITETLEDQFSSSSSVTYRKNISKERVDFCI